MADTWNSDSAAIELYFKVAGGSSLTGMTGAHIVEDLDKIIYKYNTQHNGTKLCIDVDRRYLEDQIRQVLRINELSLKMSADFDNKSFDKYMGGIKKKWESANRPTGIFEADGKALEKQYDVPLQKLKELAKEVARLERLASWNSGNDDIYASAQKAAQNVRAEMTKIYNQSGMTAEVWRALKPTVDTIYWDTRKIDWSSYFSGIDKDRLLEASQSLYTSLQNETFAKTVGEEFKAGFLQSAKTLRQLANNEIETILPSNLPASKAIREDFAVMEKYMKTMDVFIVDYTGGMKNVADIVLKARVDQEAGVKLTEDEKNANLSNNRVLGEKVALLEKRNKTEEAAEKIRARVEIRDAKAKNEQELAAENPVPAATTSKKGRPRKKNDANVAPTAQAVADADNLNDKVNETVQIVGTLNPAFKDAFSPIREAVDDVDAFDKKLEKEISNGAFAKFNEEEKVFATSTYGTVTDREYARAQASDYIYKEIVNFIGTLGSSAGGDIISNVAHDAKRVLMQELETIVPNTSDMLIATRSKKGQRDLADDQNDLNNIIDEGTQKVNELGEAFKNALAPLGQIFKKGSEGAKNFNNALESLISDEGRALPRRFVNRKSELLSTTKFYQEGQDPETERNNILVALNRSIKATIDTFITEIFSKDNLKNKRTSSTEQKIQEAKDAARDAIDEIISDELDDLNIDMKKSEPGGSNFGPSLDKAIFSKKTKEANDTIDVATDATTDFAKELIKAGIILQTVVGGEVVTTAQGKLYNRIEQLGADNHNLSATDLGKKTKNEQGETVTVAEQRVAHLQKVAAGIRADINAEYATKTGKKEQAEQKKLLDVLERRLIIEESIIEAKQGTANIDYDDLTDEEKLMRLMDQESSQREDLSIMQLRSNRNQISAQEGKINAAINRDLQELETKLQGEVTDESLYVNEINEQYDKARESRKEIIDMLGKAYKNADDSDVENFFGKEVQDFRAAAEQKWEDAKDEIFVKVRVDNGEFVEASSEIIKLMDTQFISEAALCDQQLERNRIIGDIVENEEKQLVLQRKINSANGESQAVQLVQKRNDDYIAEIDRKTLAYLDRVSTTKYLTDRDLNNTRGTSPSLLESLKTDRAEIVKFIDDTVNSLLRGNDAAADKIIDLLREEKDEGKDNTFEKEEQLLIEQSNTSTIKELKEIRSVIQNAPVGNINMEAISKSYKNTGMKYYGARLLSGKQWLNGMGDTLQIGSRADVIALDKEYVTQEEYDQIVPELQEKIAHWRKELNSESLIEATKEARAFGDLSENAEYNSIEELRADIADKIAGCEERIRNIEVRTQEDIDKIKSLQAAWHEEKRNNPNSAVAHNNMAVLPQNAYSTNPGQKLAERYFDVYDKMGWSNENVNERMSFYGAPNAVAVESMRSLSEEMETVCDNAEGLDDISGILRGLGENCEKLGVQCSSIEHFDEALKGAQLSTKKLAQVSSADENLTEYFNKDRGYSEAANKLSGKKLMDTVSEPFIKRGRIKEDYILPYIQSLRDTFNQLNIEMGEDAKTSFENSLKELENALRSSKGVLNNEHVQNVMSGIQKLAPELENALHVGWTDVLPEELSDRDAQVLTITVKEYIDALRKALSPLGEINQDTEDKLSRLADILHSNRSNLHDAEVQSILTDIYSQNFGIPERIISSRGFGVYYDKRKNNLKQAKDKTMDESIRNYISQLYNAVREAYGVDELDETTKKIIEQVRDELMRNNGNLQSDIVKSCLAELNNPKIEENFNKTLGKYYYRRKNLILPGVRDETTGKETDSAENYVNKLGEELLKRRQKFNSNLKELDDDTKNELERLKNILKSNGYNLDTAEVQDILTGLPIHSGEGQFSENELRAATFVETFRNELEQFGPITEKTRKQLQDLYNALKVPGAGLGDQNVQEIIKGFVTIGDEIKKDRTELIGLFKAIDSYLDINKFDKMTSPLREMGKEMTDIWELQKKKNPEHSSPVAYLFHSTGANLDVPDAGGPDGYIDVSVSKLADEIDKARENQDVKALKSAVSRAQELLKAIGTARKEDVGGYSTQVQNVLDRTVEVLKNTIAGANRIIETGNFNTDITKSGLEDVMSKIETAITRVQDSQFEGGGVAAQDLLDRLFNVKGVVNDLLNGDLSNMTQDIVATSENIRAGLDMLPDSYRKGFEGLDDFIDEGEEVARSGIIWGDSVKKLAQSGQEVVKDTADFTQGGKQLSIVGKSIREAGIAGASISQALSDSGEPVKELANDILILKSGVEDLLSEGKISERAAKSFMEALSPLERAVNVFNEEGKGTIGNLRKIVSEYSIFSSELSKKGETDKIRNALQSPISSITSTVSEISKTEGKFETFMNKAGLAVSGIMSPGDLQAMIENSEGEVPTALVTAITKAMEASKPSIAKFGDTLSGSISVGGRLIKIIDALRLEEDPMAGITQSLLDECQASDVTEHSLSGLLKLQERIAGEALLASKNKEKNPNDSTYHGIRASLLMNARNNIYREMSQNGQLSVFDQDTLNNNMIQLMSESTIKKLDKNVNAFSRGAKALESARKEYVAEYKKFLSSGGGEDNPYRQNMQNIQLRMENIASSLRNKYANAGAAGQRQIDNLYPNLDITNEGIRTLIDGQMQAVDKEQKWNTERKKRNDLEDEYAKKLKLLRNNRIKLAEQEAIGNGDANSTKLLRARINSLESETFGLKKGEDGLRGSHKNKIKEDYEQGLLSKDAYERLTKARKEDEKTIAAEEKLLGLLGNYNPTKIFGNSGGTKSFEYANGFKLLQEIQNWKDTLRNTPMTDVATVKKIKETIKTLEDTFDTMTGNAIKDENGGYTIPGEHKGLTNEQVSYLKQLQEAYEDVDKRREEYAKAQNEDADTMRAELEGQEEIEERIKGIIDKAFEKRKEAIALYDSIDMSRFEATLKQEDQFYEELGEGMKYYSSNNLMSKDTYNNIMSYLNEKMKDSEEKYAGAQLKDVTARYKEFMNAQKALAAANIEDADSFDILKKKAQKAEEALYRAFNIDISNFTSSNGEKLGLLEVIQNSSVYRNFDATQQHQFDVLYRNSESDMEKTYSNIAQKENKIREKEENSVANLTKRYDHLKAKLIGVMERYKDLPKISQKAADAMERAQKVYDTPLTGPDVHSVIDDFEKVHGKQLEYKGLIQDLRNLEKQGVTTTALDALEKKYTTIGGRAEEFNNLFKQTTASIEKKVDVSESLDVAANSFKKLTENATKYVQVSERIQQVTARTSGTIFQNYASKQIERLDSKSRKKGVQNYQSSYIKSFVDSLQEQQKDGTLSEQSVFGNSEGNKGLYNETKKKLNAAVEDRRKLYERLKNVEMLSLEEINDIYKDFSSSQDVVVKNIITQMGERVKSAEKEVTDVSLMKKISKDEAAPFVEAKMFDEPLIGAIKDIDIEKAVGNTEYLSAFVEENQDLFTEKSKALFNELIKEQKSGLNEDELIEWLDEIILELANGVQQANEFYQAINQAEFGREDPWKAEYVIPKEELNNLKKSVKEGEKEISILNSFNAEKLLKQSRKDTNAAYLDKYRKNYSKNINAGELSDFFKEVENNRASGALSRSALEEQMQEEGINEAGIEALSKDTENLESLYKVITKRGSIKRKDIAALNELFKDEQDESVRNVMNALTNASLFEGKNKIKISALGINPEDIDAIGDRIEKNNNRIKAVGGFNLDKLFGGSQYFSEEDYHNIVKAYTGAAKNNPLLYQKIDKELRGQIGKSIESDSFKGITQDILNLISQGEGYENFIKRVEDLSANFSIEGFAKLKADFGDIIALSPEMAKAFDTVQSAIKNTSVSGEDFIKDLDNMEFPQEKAEQYTQIIKYLKESLQNEDGSWKDVNIDWIAKMEKEIPGLDGVGDDALEVFKKITEASKQFASGGLKAVVDAMDQFVTQVERSFSEEELATNNFMNKLKNAFGTNIVQKASSMVMMTLTNAVKQIYTNCKNLESSLAQLRIVSKDVSVNTEGFVKNVAETAQATASSVNSLIESVTTYARLGYSVSESLKFAELTAKYSKVANVDSSSATTNITGIIKAFDISVNDLERVLDELITVGNNYAISSAELGEGLNNAAAALVANGNTLEQSMGMLAAANATVQDVSRASTAVRTVAARVSNSTSELEDLGEDTTELISTANLAKEMEAFGVEIMDANGELLSTYDILDQVAAQWNSYSNTAQASIAALLAGTRQQSVFYSMIQNWDDAKEAVEACGDASGELSSSYDVYIKTIEGRISQLSAAWEEFSEGVMDSAVVKGLVQAITWVVNLLNKITPALKSLQTVFVALFAVLGNGIVNSITKNLKSAKEAARGLNVEMEKTQELITGEEGGGKKKKRGGWIGSMFGNTFKAFTNLRNPSKKENNETPETDAAADIAEATANETKKRNKHAKAIKNEEKQEKALTEEEQAEEDLLDNLAATDAEYHEIREEEKANSKEIIKNNKDETASLNKMFNSLTMVAEIGMSLLQMAVENTDQNSAKVLETVAIAIIGIGAAIVIVINMVKAAQATAGGIIAIITLLTTVVMAIVSLCNNWETMSVKAAKANEEALADSLEALEKYKDELEELIDDYDELSDRIDELKTLQASGEINAAELDELERDIEMLNLYEQEMMDAQAKVNKAERETAQLATTYANNLTDVTYSYKSMFNQKSKKSNGFYDAVVNDENFNVNNMSKEDWLVAMSKYYNLLTSEEKEVYDNEIAKLQDYAEQLYHSDAEIQEIADRVTGGDVDALLNLSEYSYLQDENDAYKQIRMTYYKTTLAYGNTGYDDTLKNMLGSSMYSDARSFLDTIGKLNLEIDKEIEAFEKGIKDLDENGIRELLKAQGMNDTEIDRWIEENYDDLECIQYALNGLTDEEMEIAANILGMDVDEFSKAMGHLTEEEKTAILNSTEFADDVDRITAILEGVDNDRLLELATDFGYTAEEISNIVNDAVKNMSDYDGISELIADMQELGMISNDLYDDYIEYLFPNYIMDWLGESIVGSIYTVGYSNALEDMDEEFDLLKDALDDINDIGIISADTIQDLLENYEELVDEYFVLTDQGYQLKEEWSDLDTINVLEDYIANQISGYVNIYQDAKDAYDEACAALYDDEGNYLLEGQELLEAIEDLIALSADVDASWSNVEDYMSTSATKLREEEIDAITDALNDQIDALNDQLDKYSDLIDLRKDLLETYKDEIDYQKSLAEKTKSVSDLETQLAVAQLDNSAAGLARQRELQDELNSAKEELDDFTLEQAIDRVTNQLDKEGTEFESVINKQTQELEDAIEDLAKRTTIIITPEEKDGRYTGEVTVSASYHTGGFVGDEINDNEEFAKLLKGEFVATPAMMQQFMDTTLPGIAEAASATKNLSGYTFNSPLITLNCEGITTEAIPSMEKIVKQAVSEVEKHIDSGFSRAGRNTRSLNLSL